MVMKISPHIQNCDASTIMQKWKNEKIILRTFFENRKNWWFSKNILKEINICQFEKIFWKFSQFFSFKVLTFGEIFIAIVFSLYMFLQVENKTFIHLFLENHQFSPIFNNFSENVPNIIFSFFWHFCTHTYFLQVENKTFMTLRKWIIRIYIYIYIYVRMTLAEKRKLETSLYWTTWMLLRMS